MMREGAAITRKKKKESSHLLTHELSLTAESTSFLTTEKSLQFSDHTGLSYIVQM